jgi:hypothetical protein
MQRGGAVGGSASVRLQQGLDALAADAGLPRRQPVVEPRARRPRRGRETGKEGRRPTLTKEKTGGAYGADPITDTEAI